MGYFSVLLDLTQRRCVMVGGGPIAERRVLSLLEAGAQVTVISPRATPALEALALEGRIALESRTYEEGDLAGAQLAFVATAAREVNLAVAREARARGVWINAADDPAHCTFILPAIVRRGDLTVSVATGGTSPALSRAIREELETYLTADYATLAALAAEAWRRALGPEVRRLIVERGRDTAKLRLLELLGVETCAP